MSQSTDEVDFKAKLTKYFNLKYSICIWKIEKSLLVVYVYFVCFNSYFLFISCCFKISFFFNFWTNNSKSRRIIFLWVWIRASWAVSCSFFFSLLFFNSYFFAFWFRNYFAFVFSFCFCFFLLLSFCSFCGFICFFPLFRTSFWVKRW